MSMWIFKKVLFIIIDFFEFFLSILAIFGPFWVFLAVFFRGAFFLGLGIKDWPTAAQPAWYNAFLPCSPLLHWWGWELREVEDRNKGNGLKPSLWFISLCVCVAGGTEIGRCRNIFVFHSHTFYYVSHFVSMLYTLYVLYTLYPQCIPLYGIYSAYSATKLR